MELAISLIQSLINSNIISFGRNQVNIKNNENDSQRLTLCEERIKYMSLVSDDCDSWNKKNIKTKRFENTVIDSVSEALSSGKGLGNQVKKLEREKRKEDARVKRRNQKIKMYDDPTPTISSTPWANGSSVSKNVSDIHIRDISMSIGSGQLLLDHADLKIVRGRKYGLIGRNGCGKSTLLHAISKKRLEGLPSNLAVVHVEQVR